MRTLGVMAMSMAAVAGCGDEPSFVEYAEVCGEAGPVRVLELSPGERLNPAPWKFGERVVYTIGRATNDLLMQFLPWNSTMVTVWTTGPCGESPRKLAEDIKSVFTLERWPGVLLACDQHAGQVLALDPEGVRPANVVFTGLSDCELRWTAFGLVSVEESVEEDGSSLTGRLRLHPYPQDPSVDEVEPVTLLGTVRTRSSLGFPSSQQLRVFDEFALAVTADATLVQIALADGAVTPVQSGVAGFLADATGRTLLWQDATPTSLEVDYPEGKLFLRDRNDGSDVFLGEAAIELNWNALNYLEHGFIVITRDTIRVFSLPGLGFIDLPRLNFRAEVDAQHWLMASPQMIGVVDLVSGEAKELVQLVHGKGDIVRVRDEGFDLLKTTPCCGTGNSWRDEASLWFVPYAGEPRRLAARATRFGDTLRDGRRVALVDIDGDWHGNLELIDPGADTVLRIDEGVFAGVYLAPEVFGEDVVVYSIPGDERTGVWIARMPAG